MAYDLAAQLEVAREAFLQDAQEAREFAKVQRPCYQMPSQLILETHAARCRAEKSNTHPRARKTIIAAGTKHHSTFHLNRLEVVPLERCRFGINAAPKRVTGGKALVLRRRKGTEAYRTTGLYILAEDAQGWLVPVLIQNASPQYERLLQPETVFIIKEPWIKPSREGYIVRVETPTDIITWPIAFSHPESFKSYSTAAEYKRAGSQHFVEGRFAQALATYQAGIYHHWRSETERTEVFLMNLNAAAAALKVHLPCLALQQLDAINLQYFTQLQKNKAYHRRALALYEIGKYDAAIEVLGWGVETEESRELLQRARRRTEEQTTGVYNWSEVYSRAQANHSTIDIADYVGPVSIGFSSGKGKGLRATHALDPGQLILVSKPLASAKPDHSITDVVLGLNMSSRSLDTYTQTSIPGLLAYKALYDETPLRNLDELYAGPEETRKPAQDPYATYDWLDVGRAEGVCTYNSFRPTCITQMYQETAKQGSTGPNEPNDHLHSASALYHMPSFMNHACVGNACYTFFGDIFVLRAVKRIAAGEEVLDSYCNAMDPLPNRTEHLGRYGFVCRCSLCEEDRADGEEALDHRRSLLSQLLSQRQSKSPRAVEKIIQEIHKTYQSSRKGPRPDLYACYRILATAYTDQDDILEAEVRALEALGVSFSLPRPAKLSHTPDFSSLTVPSLGLQDAIISYIKFSNDSFHAGFQDAAQVWKQEARRLHAIVYGPGIFDVHMRSFISAQGWSAVLEMQ